MSTLEEQLWNYIDGQCEPAVQIAVEQKLATDKAYYTLYQELLAIHQELNNLELEEPSMSFTRNVMEQTQLELAPVVLKTRVDRRIIYAIAAFFALSIFGILGFIIAQSDLTFSDMPKMDFTVDTHKLISPLSIQLFILVDIILILVYLDSYLRKGKINAQKKGA